MKNEYADHFKDLKSIYEKDQSALKRCNDFLIDNSSQKFIKEGDSVYRKVPNSALFIKEGDSVYRQVPNSALRKTTNANFTDLRTNVIKANPDDLFYLNDNKLIKTDPKLLTHKDVDLYVKLKSEDAFSVVFDRQMARHMDLGYERFSINYHRVVVDLLKENQNMTYSDALSRADSLFYKYSHQVKRGIVVGNSFPTSEVQEVNFILEENIESLANCVSGFTNSAIDNPKTFFDLAKGVVILLSLSTYLFQPDTTLEDEIKKNNGNEYECNECAEEVSFLKACNLLNQCLDFENPEVKLSDKYLGFVNEFNNRFSEFFKNEEILRNLSSQCLLYSLKLFKKIEDFEVKYSLNGFTSNELIILGDNLCNLIYVRSGLNTSTDIQDIKNEQDFSLDKNCLNIVKAPAKLTYTMLEPLCIDDVVLTLNVDGNPVDVAYYDFPKYGITVNRQSGWALSLEDKFITFCYEKDGKKYSTSIGINVEVPDFLKPCADKYYLAENYNSIMDLLKDFYSSLYGDSDRLSEDIKRTTASILTPVSAYAIGLNVLNVTVNTVSFVYSMVAIVCTSLPAIGTACTVAMLLVGLVSSFASAPDACCVDFINISTQGLEPCKFYFRDWVNETPEIIPADNIPYDLTIKTSDDYDSGFSGSVRVQFISENSEDGNNLQTSSQIHKVAAYGSYDFSRGTLNDYWFADKNIGDISKIKLYVDSNESWKLKYLILKVNGKVYKFNYNNWVNGNIELIPENGASSAYYDVLLKTTEETTNTNYSLNVKFNGKNKDSDFVPIYKHYNYAVGAYEISDRFVNDVTELQSLTIKNKGCELPIDYLLINGQKYYVRQIISSNQEINIDVLNKKSAYDVSFKISDIASLNSDDNLYDNLSVNISGKDFSGNPVSLEQQPLNKLISNKEGLQAGSLTTFYLADTLQIATIDSICINKLKNEKPLPLDYIEITPHCIDLSGYLVDLEPQRFYCGKFLEDSITLSTSDNVFDFDFMNLSGNDIKSFNPYSFVLENKFSADPSQNVLQTKKFFPALDFNSNKSQHLKIADSCGFDKVGKIHITAETNEPWGLDYVSYENLNSKVNKKLTNEGSSFVIDFTKSYTVKIYTGAKSFSSDLKFEIVGQNNIETNTRSFRTNSSNFYLANNEYITQFEDSNCLDKLYGLKLSANDDFYLDRVEVISNIGNHVFEYGRVFKGEIELSIEDQVLTVGAKTGDVKFGGAYGDFSFKLFKEENIAGQKVTISKTPVLDFSNACFSRKQGDCQIFGLTKLESVTDFNRIEICKNSSWFGDFNKWFLDSITINDVCYFYRAWVGSNEDIVIDASAPKTGYDIELMTSDLQNAGTDGDVSIILENDKGDKSEEIPLNLENVNDRESGDKDNYFIACNFDSNVDKCIVKVSDKCIGSWAFDYIKIVQYDNGGRKKDEHTFNYGRWVNRSETVLSKKDINYNISTKCMDSIKQEGGVKCDSIWLVEKDESGKVVHRSDEIKHEFQIAGGGISAGFNYTSLVSDPNEDPINKVTSVDVCGNSTYHWYLDYVQVNDKFFYYRRCVETSFGGKIETIDDCYHPYDVFVSTGYRENAGTNGDISINFIGTDSKKQSIYTGFMKLDTPGTLDFCLGDSMPYYLKNKIELDTLSRIEIQKDGGGDWGLDYLTVTLPNGIVYTFDCYDWVKDDKLILYPNGGTSAKSYNVTIKTGTDYFAGTDSDIYVKIIGVDYQNNTIETNSHLLDKYLNNDFESGNVDSYAFFDTPDIVTIKKITLENKGDDKWQVNNVEVDFDNCCYIFDCHDDWITHQEKSFELTEKGEGSSYAVMIKTADKALAATDANVRITVYGKDDTKTKESHLLDKPNYNDFERNDSDIYFFVDKVNLNEIEKITLHNDGSFFGSDWCVDSLKLYHNGRSYEFVCNQFWINGGKTETFYPTCVDRPDIKKNASFKVVTKTLFSDDCGTDNDIYVEIIGNKGATPFQELRRYNRSIGFEKGDYDSFSFSGAYIGDKVEKISFYKTGFDMWGVDYINVYYNNRWYKARFGKEVDKSKEIYTQDAVPIGVVFTH